MQFLFEQELKRPCRMYPGPAVSSKGAVNAALKSCCRRSNTGNPEQVVCLKQANNASE